MIAPALTVAIIASQGNLDRYIFWNWTFNLSGYMDGVPLDSHFLRKLVLSNVFVPAFALMIFQQGNRRGAWVLVLGMWFAGAILLYPRFGESAAASHMPFAALMSGVVLVQVVPPMIRAG